MLWKKLWKKVNYAPKKLSAKYYQENKGRLWKKVRERYQNLSKEEKEKKATI